MPDPLVCAPGPRPGTVRSPAGEILTPPADWVLVPPGDPALTRRLKAAGPTWVVQEKAGRKVFSKGVYGPREAVEAIRAALFVERADPAYARKRQAAAERRGREQAEYVGSFKDAVLAYLAFDPAHAGLAERLATAITEHATPVGSGTVARTERIPIEDRAEAATIAWMRHRTTAYDHMSIPRAKGRRREVRRMLAEQSKRLLARYRATATAPNPAGCPLCRALANPASDPPENAGV